MAYEIVSFDGYVFAEHDWYAAVPLEGARAQFAVESRATPRAGNTSLLSAGAISPLRLPVDVTLEPNAALAVLPAIDQLVGALDPRDQTARLLVADRNGETVERYARIEIPTGWSSSGAANVV